MLSRLTARPPSGRPYVIDRPFLPPGCLVRLRRHHPSLSDADLARVESGLRDWFHVCAATGGQQVAMPSPVVDDLWHEFILHTRDYARFCDAALGRFLHHTPTAAMGKDEHDGQSAALRTTYEAALPRHSGPGLPALFCLDAELGLPAAPRYVQRCATTTCSATSAICLEHLPRTGHPGRRPGRPAGGSRRGARGGGRGGGCGGGGGWGGWGDGSGGGDGGGGGSGCGGGCGS